MITSAGKSSAVEDQFSFSMPLSIKIATYIKAPAVAYGGIIEARGDKNIANKNNKPTTIEVSPVRPPASTPAELSTSLVTGEQPKNVPNILALLSAFRALLSSSDCSSLLIKFALVATPSSVPVVSNKFTNKNDIIIVNIPRFNAPKISSFINVGAISGGYDTIPLNSIKPKKYAIKVVVKIPIIIAPVTFLTDKIEITNYSKSCSTLWIDRIVAS